MVIPLFLSYCHLLVGIPERQILLCFHIGEMTKVRDVYSRDYLLKPLREYSWFIPTIYLGVTEPSTKCTEPHTGRDKRDYIYLKLFRNPGSR